MFGWLIAGAERRADLAVVGRQSYRHWSHCRHTSFVGDVVVGMIRRRLAIASTLLQSRAFRRAIRRTKDTPDAHSLEMTSDAETRTAKLGAMRWAIGPTARNITMVQVL